jgi:hypothetical protein
MEKIIVVVVATISIASVLTASPGTAGGSAPDGKAPAAAESQEFSQDTARSHAQQLLDKTSQIIRAREAGDAKALSVFLGSRPAVLENLALIRLSDLGLPADLRTKLVKARMGADAAGEEAAKKAILAWARKHDESSPPKDATGEVSQSMAVLVISGAWHEEIRYKRGTEASAREYATALVGFSGIVSEDSAKEVVAYEEVVLFDEDELQSEVHIHLDKGRLSGATVDEALAKMRVWIAANLQYCFFHPEERSFKFDAEARAAGQASSDYRKQHPWGKDEGPNKTDPEKVPYR